MSELRAVNLKKQYKSRVVVTDVSLEVSSGEVIGLLGPNGAGKTTCFYMMVGLVAMDGGDITLDRVENGTVYVHMQGSCSGCPSSTATLRMGIETRLREAFPELVEVVAV